MGITDARCRMIKLIYVIRKRDDDASTFTARNATFAGLIFSRPMDQLPRGLFTCITCANFLKSNPNIRLTQ